MQTRRQPRTAEPRPPHRATGRPKGRPPEYSGNCSDCNRDRPHKARGLCNTCYLRQRRTLDGLDRVGRCMAAPCTLWAERYGLCIEHRHDLDLLTHHIARVRALPLEP